MNVKMWGPILAGAVIEAIGIILFVVYGYIFMSKPTSFTFSYGNLDFAAFVLSIIGLALIMFGGYQKK
ncbi:MAG: hypothetical protein RRE78_07780 [Acidianus sp.]|jgi:hypothetical protein|nr:hypothetical protein [Acidianus sp.]